MIKDNMGLKLVIKDNMELDNMEVKLVFIKIKLALLHHHMLQLVVKDTMEEINQVVRIQVVRIKVKDNMEKVNLVVSHIQDKPLKVRQIKDDIRCLQVIFEQRI